MQVTYTLTQAEYEHATQAYGALRDLLNTHNPYPEH